MDDETGPVDTAAVSDTWVHYFIISVKMICQLEKIANPWPE